MKSVLTIFGALLFSFNLMAQDTTIIRFNGKKCASALIKEDDTQAQLKLSGSYRKAAGTIEIMFISPKLQNANYKHTLEIDGLNAVFIEETKSKPGHFSLPAQQFYANLAVGKPASLYVMFNPANPNLAIPSRRLFAGNVLVK